MDGAMALNAIHKVIDDERDHVISLTREMVHIPSVNPKLETGDGLNREADVQAFPG